MINKFAPIALAAALTAGCATLGSTGGDRTAELRIGQTTEFGGHKVTVLKLVEDSRCPVEVNCVWAGRVKITLGIDRRDGTNVRELGSDAPIQALGGTLELLRTQPDRRADRNIAPGDYRFTIRYTR